MEPARAERTRRSSSGQPSRNAFTASPLRPRSTPRKRKRKAKASAEYYSVRDILDEETKNEQIYYLIDWEDNPDTGESYTPTWEPYHNVNWEAIAAWEKKKLETQNGSAFDDRERSSTFDSDPEPIRRSKRQRIAEGPLRKKPPQADTEKPPSVHPVHQEKGLEIKDSYETEQTLNNGKTEKVLVLVPPVDDGFDRSAYAIVSTISSDPSQASKPSQDSVYLPSLPEFKSPAPVRRPFLWDEPAPVIPDSQELPGSQPYIHSEQAEAPSHDTQLTSYDSDVSAGPARQLLPYALEVISSRPPPSVEASSQNQSTRAVHSQPAQLTIAFITNNSESPEESWQAAQIRSPPPYRSTQLSTQTASTSEGGYPPRHSVQPRDPTAGSQLPEKIVESPEKHKSTQVIACSHQLMDQDSTGSPLPPRPTPPSDSNMADRSMNFSMDVADMLKQARATAAANTIARQAEARAVSSAPSTQPLASNQMLPLRSTAEAQPISSTSSRNSSESGSISKALQILPLGVEEYVVPLPLNGITRDIYDGELTNFRRQQKAFLKSEVPDDGLVSEIDSLIDRLKELCDHQDLLRSDLSTQEMDPFEVQAAWAENISTKCVFLSSFLTLLRPFNIHVTLVARPGRMVDILEAILRKERCNYTRQGRTDFSPDVATLGPLRITLLPSDFYTHDVGIEPASMVIAFDSTFEKGRYPAQLRDDPLHPGCLAPLVHLTVIRSIEHFELCFDKQMNPVDRRAALVSCVLQSRHEVGVLPPGYYSPPAAATEVGMFASSMPTDRSWPLRPMPILDGLEFELDTSEEAQEEGQSDELQDQAQPSETLPESNGMPSAQLLQPTFKRSLGAEDDDASSKRQRLTPVIDESPRSMDPSRIRNILNPMDIEPSPPIVELDVLQPDVQHTDEANLMSSLRKKVTDLELELQQRDASQAELRIQNQLLESSRRDLEKTIQDMQPKYQEALNDRGRFEHEMKESVTHANTLQQRLNLRTSELTKLRDEKTASDAELAAARTALTGSAVPEVAELSRVKQEMTTVRGENERLQKRVTSMQSELEYMRTNYQQASSAAAEAVSELNEVKAELSAAQQKASENARLIHESQASSETKQYLIRIKELEAEKSGAEWELEKKSEELRAMLNGRRATRGTSVPRSPRMGTMSPGSRPMARVLSVGSRGNSPAPGDGPPYRGTFTGEALFTTVPGSSRFGNHLM